MRLEEVLPAYREGKRIRQKSWGPNRIGIGKDYRGRLSIDEVMGDDWEVVEPPPARVMGRGEAERVRDEDGDPTDEEVVLMARDYLRLLAVAEKAERVYRACDKRTLLIRDLGLALRAAGFPGEGGSP